MNLKLAPLLLLLGSLAGCANADQFRSYELHRAAYDLGCTEQDVKLTDIADSTVGAACGDRRISYRYVPYVGWVAQVGSSR